jgi:hypothetical protein
VGVINDGRDAALGAISAVSRHCSASAHALKELPVPS